jgi:hypothetical protein
MRGADAWIQRGVWRGRRHYAYSHNRAQRFGRTGGCAQPGTPSVGLAGSVAVASHGRGFAHYDERANGRRNV